MKNLILFKAVDGYQIITGFRCRRINPRKTKRVVMEIIKEQPEPQYILDAKDEVHIALKVKGPPKEAIKAKAHARMIEASKRYKTEIEQLQSEHIEYMPVKPDQIYSEDTTVLHTAFKALKKGELLAVDGKVIKDCRGREYWKKTDDTWAMTRISEIWATKPTGSKLYKNLTDADRLEIAEQTEVERVAALTAEQKTAEKDRMITAAGHTAARNRSIAEIGGATAEDALSDAQAWLAAETSAIETKYA